MADQAINEALTALKKTQAQVQILKDRLANVRLGYGVLQARLNAKSRGRGWPAKPTTSEATLVEHHERIVMFGKCWTLLHEPWLDKGVFMRPLPSGAPNPFSLERFTDFSTYKDLAITELHEYFDDAPAFREMMEGLPAF
ncbi:hypothetical protein K435DRAFT_803634 [Dendrothele bispora CBS 962.96]|uniref:Uncharacterized protein n=1 Tax=Dendrothele bispora (strain CBS 962.96) TaxID=1314807 RepID=A0A4S8LGP2_DENBC|nr:hypothetical protein K435DRAFT_803634 [Dendrothele bispora CBS 962.96]